MHSPRPISIQIARSDLHPPFLRFTGEALAGDDLHGPVLLADLIDFMVSCEQAAGGLERLLSRAARSRSLGRTSLNSLSSARPTSPSWSGISSSMSPK
jgi:hypothetical protein